MEFWTQHALKRLCRGSREHRSPRVFSSPLVRIGRMLVCPSPPDVHVHVLLGTLASKPQAQAVKFYRRTFFRELGLPPRQIDYN